VAAGRRPRSAGPRGEGDRIVAGLVEAVRRHGFREYDHPHTGAGIGAHGFGWSTLVAALAAGRGEET